MELTERSTKADWAGVVRKLADEDYADRERIALVMDNVNTHHLPCPACPSRPQLADHPIIPTVHTNRPCNTKLKPRWDVHFQVLGNRAGGFSGVSRPLIAGRSGSAV